MQNYFAMQLVTFGNPDVERKPGLETAVRTLGYNFVSSFPHNRLGDYTWQQDIAAFVQTNQIMFI